MSVTPLLRRVAPGLPAARFPDRRDVFPVLSPLDTLFPDGGLTRGSVVSVDSPALALGVVARASRAGVWCAVVGLPSLAAGAAGEIGVDLTRFVVVPTPGEAWATATATLLDGIGIVLVAPPRDTRGAEVRQLAGRVRERRGVLVAVGGWPEQIALRLRIESSEWSGIGSDGGYGRLTGRRCTISAHGRGAAARERRVLAWLPLGC